MLLYKYRSLENFEYVLDIIFNERLHCAPYEELNDPFEGIFLSTYTIGAPPTLGYPYGGINASRPVSPSLGKLLGREISSHHNVNEICFDRQKNKICSLSASLNDVRLWSYYADGHKGITFELDLPEDTSSLHPVTYSETLPKFSGTVLGAPYSHEVLSCKTKHWAHEEEYRIISEDSFFPVAGKIKAIYLGGRITDSYRDLLKKVIAGKFPIYRTQINKIKIAVEPIGEEVGQ